MKSEIPAPTTADTQLAVLPKGMEGAFSQEEWSAMTLAEKGAAMLFFAEEEHEARTIGLDRSLFRIKLPGSGGTEFEIPNPAGGDPILAKEIEGIVVWAQPIRDYYPNDQPQGKPPKCASPDRIKPYDTTDKEAATCAACPQNQWGSKGEKGKACKEKYRLFIRRTGFDLPTMMTLPTMGAKEFESYVTGLRLQKMVPSAVRTTFYITKAKNADNTSYPLVKEKVSGKITFKEMQETATLREMAKRVASEFGVRLHEEEPVVTPTTSAPATNGAHGEPEILNADRTPVV